MAVGILSKEEVRGELTPSGETHHRIYRPSSQPLALDLSAIDLSLGDRYWIMKGSCRSGPDLTVADLQRYYAEGGARTLADPTTLERGKVYLIQLDCKVELAGTRIRGKSTGRSSIGRLDVLVRMLSESGGEFDRLPEGERGELFVEVAPITFSLIVRPGTRLSQLRLFRGEEDLFTLTKDELQYEDPFPVVSQDGGPLEDRCRGRETTFPFSLDVSPDPASGCSGYVAKASPPDAVDPDRKAYYDPTDFWEPVELKGERSLHLVPNRLYILRSEERLRLPGHLAVECQTYTETLGEWRIEYAGFAHPWFGFSRDNGTPIIFEVRGHNIPTILRQGLPLGKVSFRRMSKEAEKPEKEQQYEKQELKLSSCFKPWPS
jgi:dCTP deaminase